MPFRLLDLARIASEYSREMQTPRGRWSASCRNRALARTHPPQIQPTVLHANCVHARPEAVRPLPRPLVGTEMKEER